jgi:hypothetical protein
MIPGRRSERASAARSPFRPRVAAADSEAGFSSISPVADLDDHDSRADHVGWAPLTSKGLGA